MFGMEDDLSDVMDEAIDAGDTIVQEFKTKYGEKSLPYLAARKVFREMRRILHQPLK